MWTRLAVLAAVVGVCFGGGELLWTAGTESSVYDDVVLSHENTASTTDFMASPYMLATYHAAGRGQPLWMWVGQAEPEVRMEFYATSLRAPSRPVLVDLIGVEYGAHNNTIIIHAFEATSNRPIWEHMIFNAQNAFQGQHLIDVAEDGSFFVILYYDTHDLTTKLVVFDAQTGHISTTYVVDPKKTPHNPRRVDISLNGMVVTFVDHTSVYSLDTATRALRGDVLELPGDYFAHEIMANQEGNFFTAGHDNIVAWNWDFRNRKFVKVFETEKKTWGTLDALHLGRNGLLIAGWARADGKQTLFERYEIYNGTTPSWTVMTKEAEGRNFVDDIESDLFGEFIAAASWGNTAGDNPQVMVFDANRRSTQVIYQYHTPGSMFAVDVMREGPAAVVCAAGKHAHATDRTHFGGDVFCFRVTRD